MITTNSLKSRFAAPALLGCALLAFSGTAANAQRVAADGSYPQSGLMLANDGNLYGMTYYGGAYNNGTIYKIAQNGTGYTIVHSFVGGAAEGAQPSGTLFQGGDGNFYGVTFNGGRYNYGTVFELTSTGTFSTLYAFTGPEGAHPIGITGDLSSTPTLYGVAYDGGGGGTLFKTTSTGATTALYSFGGTNGYYPDSAPVLDGTNLFGTCSAGGSNGDGTIYKYDLSASTLTNIWDFGGVDGNSSRCTFYRDGTTLYGTTRYGGPSGIGNIFKIDETGGLTSLAYSSTSSPWYLNGNVVESSNFATDQQLLGTASDNGTNTMGCLYGMSAGVFSVKHAFSGAPSDGDGPTGLLMRIGSVYYGVTRNGGTYNTGTIYKVNEDGTGYTIIHNFDQYVKFDAGFTGNSTGTVTTMHLTTTQPNELVIANVSWRNNSTSSATLTNVVSGGTSYPWTKLTSTLQTAAGPSYIRQEVWYVLVPAVVTSQTITISVPAYAPDAINMDAYIGASIPNPIDVTPTPSTFLSTTSASCSVTTSTGNNSYVAAYTAFIASPSGSDAPTPGSGYSLTKQAFGTGGGFIIDSSFGEYNNSFIAGGSTETPSATFVQSFSGIMTAVPIRVQAAP